MSSQAARRLHGALLVLWILPGLPISWYLKESVPWVVFLSVYAIIVGHASALSAERPTEIEEEED